jgi:hypothetical protein
MGTDILNSLVSGAIWRAEQIEARNLRAEQAWAEVSAFEEELAQVVPASSSEGRIARRGAVRAALKAGDYARAQVLVERFAGDGAPPSLAHELRQILDDEAAANEGCRG